MKFNGPTRIRLKRLFPTHFNQLESILGIIDDALPHTQPAGWDFKSLGPRATTRTSVRRIGKAQKILQIDIDFEHSETQRVYRLTTSISKQHAFGYYEWLYSNSAAHRLADALEALLTETPSASFQSGIGAYISPSSLADAVVAAYLHELTDIKGFNFTEVIRFLKELAQQSYESKPISYGVLVTKRSSRTSFKSCFPAEIVGNKRFKAITDGYRTALQVSKNGMIDGLVSLTTSTRQRSGEHYRPLWLDPIAETAAAKNALGIALSRNGAILVAWKGSLILQYRTGRWTLFNHSENIDTLTTVLARIRGQAQGGLSRLASRLYRCALDVSFRRSGGLFVVLSGRRQANLNRLVPTGEELLGRKRKRGDKAIGASLENKIITGIEREIVCDLAALDGAVVCARNGQILAYGSVLKTPSKPGLHKVEGSRSRAAHSGSFFGLSIKISSDGGIEAKRNGITVLEI